MERNIVAAAYARVSTEHDDQINSLESQKCIPIGKVCRCLW